MEFRRWDPDRLQGPLGEVVVSANLQRGDGSGENHACLNEVVVARDLDRLARRRDLSAEQLAAVEAMSSALLGELLHVPTLRLRHDPDAERRVRDLFGLGS
jgi:hypothetical protein